MSNDDVLWRLTSPWAALACVAGAVTFGAWLLVRRMERELDRIAIGGQPL